MQQFNSMASLSEQLDNICKLVDAASDRHGADDDEQSRLSLAKALGNLSEAWEQRGDEHVDTEVELAVASRLKLRKQLQVVVSPEGSFNHESTRQTIPSPAGSVDNRLAKRVQSLYNLVKRSYKVFGASSSVRTSQAFVVTCNEWNQLIKLCINDDFDVSPYESMLDEVCDWEIQVRQWIKANPKADGFSNTATQPAPPPAVGQSYALDVHNEPSPTWSGDVKRFPLFVREFESHCEDRNIKSIDRKLRMLKIGVEALPEARTIVEQSGSLEVAMVELKKKYFRPYDRVHEIMRRHYGRTPLQNDQDKKVYDYISTLQADLAIMSDHHSKNLAQCYIF